MLLTKILDRVDEYIPEVEIHELQNCINDFLNGLSLQANYIDEYSNALDVLTGAHTLAGNPTTVMTNSSATLPIGDCFVGGTIKNTTDGSEATITAVTKTTITHGALSGGTNNYWAVSDVYTIDSKKIPLPRDVISVSQIFLTDTNGELYESIQDLRMEDVQEDSGYDNENCLVKDRVIYFPEDIDVDDTMLLIINRPHSEVTGVIAATTEIDIPDKYFPLIRQYCIKELCVKPIYKEKYGYLYAKFDADYNKTQLDIKASGNTAHFSTGNEY